MPILTMPRTSRSAKETAESYFDQLWQERSSFLAHWRDLSDFIQPRRSRWWPGDRNRGDRRSSKIIDSTATFAARTLRSGMHAGITSPARPWMRLSTPDPDMAEIPAVQQWLHAVEQRMYQVWLQSNLYNALPLVYGDMGLYGTAAVAVLEDAKDVLRCYAYPIGSYALGMDRRGVACSFARKYQPTIAQLLEEFWDVELEDPWSRFPASVKDSFERGHYESTVEVRWLVAPNVPTDDDEAYTPRTAWKSCHWITSQGKDEPFLREGGFEEFPVMAPRWDVLPDDIYGTDCPAMTALGDIKQLQFMQRKKSQALEKLVNPPLQAPTSVRNQKVSLLPGDLTYVDDRNNQGVRPIHDLRLDFSHITADVQDVRYLIQQAFYADLFLMLANDERRQPATATEIAERKEEKLLAIGPVLERTNDELLDPLVDRTFALMQRSGLIPPPPEELSRVDLTVEYTSIMSAALKLVGVATLDRFVGAVTTIKLHFPEAGAKLDALQLIDEYALAYGVNPKVVRSDEEATAVLQQAQQAQQAEQQAANANQLASAGKAASETSLEGDTALSRILAGLGQAQASAGVGAQV